MLKFSILTSVIFTCMIKVVWMPDYWMHFKFNFSTKNLFHMSLEVDHVLCSEIPLWNFLFYYFFKSYVKHCLNLVSIVTFLTNSFTGLIAASCGQLNVWLQAAGQPSNLRSNGFPKIYQQNGSSLKKSPKSLLNGNFHSNGNGVHVWR